MVDINIDARTKKFYPPKELDNKERESFCE